MTWQTQDKCCWTDWEGTLERLWSEGHLGQVVDPDDTGQTVAAGAENITGLSLIAPQLQVLAPAEVLV